MVNGYSNHKKIVQAQQAQKKNTELANEIWRQKATGKKQISGANYLESTNHMM